MYCVAGFAQREQIGEAVTFHDTTWYDRGFDFYIGGGMFWGGKKSALYYNGSRQNECNLDYLFNNEYYCSSHYHSFIVSSTHRLIVRYARTPRTPLPRLP